MRQKEINTLAVEVRVGELKERRENIKRGLVPPMPEHIETLDEARLDGIEAELDALQEWLEECQ